MTATGAEVLPLPDVFTAIYSPGVTVITATIPPRGRMLAELAGCIAGQERQPDAWLIEYDLRHEGAGLTRNRALFKADTEWVAIVDDDDEIFPQHLRRLVEHAEETGADVIYPNWVYGDGWESLDRRMKVPFDPEKLRKANFIPSTILVRTVLAKAVGGYPSVESAPKAENGHPCEDWKLLLRLLDVGARFEHLNEVTWRYNPHGGQCGGFVWQEGGGIRGWVS